jgi:isopentenyl diphosphate isomerase/L-lactate dehydrogenase-like FMN-dependent dehydrogenase
MEAIKELAGLPFVLKGVATAEDAMLAVEHGVSAIYVSNHGGRQLDHGRATIDMLSEIVEAVAGRAQIVFDGGVVRGSDALKAVALGARAVAIGKMQGWGLAAGGHAGLVRVLEILESEIVTTMALLGITRLDQLTPAHLCEAQLGPSHKMSAFTHIPGGQLCKFFPNRGCICRRSTRLLSEGGPAEWLRALPAWTCTILSTSAQ